MGAFTAKRVLLAEHRRLAADVIAETQEVDLRKALVRLGGRALAATGSGIGYAVLAGLDPQCGPSCSPAYNPSCWPTGTGPCSPNERADEALTELKALGVSDVGYDPAAAIRAGKRQWRGEHRPVVWVPHLRRTRGGAGMDRSGPASSPAGLPVGNVRKQPLREIMTGQRLGDVRAKLTEHSVPIRMPCVPGMCYQTSQPAPTDAPIRPFGP